MPKKSLVLQVNIVPLVLAFLIATTSNTAARPTQNEVSVADLDKQLIQSRKERINALKGFFADAKSPLKANAETFVDIADKYNLDYKLLPAIACMESSCAKKLIEGSFNPFGWGIYGRNAIYFKNYDEAIETVAKGIREKYVEKGFNTPEKIAPIYTPPNYVNWRNGVTYFMNKIDSFKGVGSEVTFSS